MDLEQLIDYANEHDASDIHLVPDHQPMVRIHGDIKQIRIGSLSAEQIKDMLYPFLSEPQKAKYEEELDLDLSVEIQDKGRYRINMFCGVHGLSVALRVIPNEIIPLEELNVPSIIMDLARLDKGLVLVTGPTGSGKSTTLAAMVHLINQEKYKHIITIEDPVEFRHTSNKCLINQREVGLHTKSFSSALKSALREDPDIILVGELRYIDNIRLALTAAETGHLVFGTLHTNSAAKSIDRIVDVFPGGDKEMVRTMLAGTLEGVISQRLLKKADNSGRVAAHEILIATPAVRNLIRENKIPQIYSLMQTSAQQGMLTMEDSVKKLLQQGIISSEIASDMLKNAEEIEASRSMNQVLSDDSSF